MRFVDLILSNKLDEAKDTLNNLLSARAFESLDAKKIELAKSMFTGKEDSVEVQDTEEV